MEKWIEIYFDGLCEPRNPGGVATYGYAIYELEKNCVQKKKLAMNSGMISEGAGMTNNVAEYTALLKALNKLALLGIDRTIPIIIRGDSNLVIQQLSGNWKIKSETSKKFVPLIRKIIKDEGLKVRFEWIKRARNYTADLLSKKAYENYCRAKGKRIRYRKAKQ